MAVAFSPSTAFRQWMTQLRVSWMGRKAQAIMGAFAKVVGDLTYDGMVQANLEHLPEYATPTSVGLIGSERQLDAGPAETTAQYASRLTNAVQLWRYAGTPLGMLVALHFAGFDNCVIVTQNGLAYTLSLPLPPLISGQQWNPASSLVVTQESPLAAPLTSSVTPTRSIPAGTPWFAFDGNTDFCSRFMVIFPGPLPSLFMTVGLATFSGTDTAAVVWNNAFSDATYHVQVGIPSVISGDADVSVVADLTTRTTTGMTLMASGAFTGTLTVIAWQTGANPFADLHPADLARLRNAIVKWKPAKATCLGVTAVVGGELWDYPFGLTWDGDSLTWDQSPSLAVQILGSV
jgi:hypothetical protein